MSKKGKGLLEIGFFVLLDYYSTEKKNMTIRSNRCLCTDLMDQLRSTLLVLAWARNTNVYMISNWEKPKGPLKEVKHKPVMSTGLTYTIPTCSFIWFWFWFFGVNFILVAQVSSHTSRYGVRILKIPFEMIKMNYRLYIYIILASWTCML